MDTLWDTMLCVFFFYHTVKQVCNIFLVKGVTGVVWSFFIILAL